MSIIEFIGFVITMGALTFLMMKRSVEERKRRMNPEEFEQEEMEEQERLKEFLRSMDLDFEEEEEPLPVPALKGKMRPPQPPKLPERPRKKTPTRTVRGNYTIKAGLEGYRTESALEKRQLESRLSAYEGLGERSVVSEEMHYLPPEHTYTVERKGMSSRASRLLSGARSKKDIVLLKEIIGPPKGFEP